MITSVRNAKIKQVRSLQGRAKARRQAGAFVVEGVRLAEEALRAGWAPELALYTAELSERGLELVRKLEESGAPLEQVAPHVMQAASDTQTPQGLLLVLPFHPLPLPKEFDFVLILDRLRDPGNLGAILRSAAAAGVQAVFLSPGTVDPFSPKVLRAAMGAHFRLPLLALGWGDIQERCRSQGLRVLLAAAAGGRPYTQADLRAPLALVVGGEAQGAGQAAQGLAAERVHIPMPGGGESLNAAMAAAVLLFEVVRQRQSPDTHQEPS